MFPAGLKLQLTIGSRNRVGSNYFRVPATRRYVFGKKAFRPRFLRTRIEFDGNKSKTERKLHQEGNAGRSKRENPLGYEPKTTALNSPD